MDNATHDIANAPEPSTAVLRRRANPLYQLWRFAALNYRFVTMIFKGGH